MTCRTSRGSGSGSTGRRSGSDDWSVPTFRRAVDDRSRRVAAGVPRPWSRAERDPADVASDTPERDPDATGWPMRDRRGWRSNA